MKSEIVEVCLEDGNIQKYQIITGFDWDELIFKSPPFDNKVIKAMAHLYTVNIIPKDKNKYGVLFFYHLNSKEIPLDRNTEIGYIYDNQVLLNYHFNKAYSKNEIRYVNDQLIIDNPILNNIYKEMMREDCIAFAKGDKKNCMSFFPVSNDMGYLSNLKNNSLLVNSHFFLMDETDLDSLYDEIGTPHGFSLYQSRVFLPPLNHRKSLLVDYNNNVSIDYLHVTDFKIKVDNYLFINNINCKVFTRPDYRETPACSGTAIIVVKNKIVAIKEGGGVFIPMAGFVIQCDNKIEKIDSLFVDYIIDKDYKFGVQVGPTMVNNHYQYLDFDSPFFNGKGTYFPSTVYPLDFNKGRAARIGIGEYNNYPIIIWAEGAGKLGYIKGKESCGASLLEFSNFCNSYGIKHLINLDGGGSAQILFKGQKQLKIADRKNDKISEAERPIPYALIVK